MITEETWKVEAGLSLSSIGQESAGVSQCHTVKASRDSGRAQASTWQTCLSAISTRDRRLEVAWAGYLMEPVLVYITHRGLNEAQVAVAQCRMQGPKQGTNCRSLFLSSVDLN